MPTATISGPDRAAPGRGFGFARQIRLIGAGLLVPLLGLVVWTVGARAGWVPPQILPAPDVVWDTALDLWQSGDLFANALISLQRVILGFAAGATLGLLLGTAMGLSKPFEAYAHVLFTALAQVPALGWIPLVMLLVGIGEPLKLIIIAVGTLVPVAWNTRAGIRAVPLGWFEAASLWRYSRAQVVWYIVLPAAVPQIFVGLRYGLGHAWLALVVVELLASSEGLGYLLVWGRQMFQLDVVIATMAVIGVIGFTLDAALAAIERRLQRWQVADQ